MRNIFSVILVSALIFNCSLFEVPEAEGEQGSGYIKPPTEPMNVIINFVSSLNNRDIENYINCFYKEFIFSPDSRDSLQDDPRYYRNWTLSVEDSVTSKLFMIVEDSFEIVPPFQVSIKMLDTVSFQENAFLYTGTYEIKSPIDGLEYVTGDIQLFLQEIENKWYIYTWVDEKTDTLYPTWGKLKAYIRKLL